MHITHVLSMHVQYLFLTATNSGANPVLVQNNPGTQAIYFIKLLHVRYDYSDTAQTVL